MSKNIKALVEKRNEKFKELTELTTKVTDEARAFTPEEQATFDKLEKEIQALTATINAIKKTNEAAANTSDPDAGGGAETEEQKKKREAEEERAFANYIRGVVETRADAVNMTQSDNGAVIPTSVANKIIEMITEISPIAKLATRYNVSGNLVVPKYDKSTQTITVAYAEEFTELTSTAGKFTSIELKGFLAGALTKVSKSLANKTNFNLVSYVVQKMAEAIAEWLEGQLLYGTTGKIEGMDTGVTQTVTAANAAKITADELIDVQEMIPDKLQNKAIWIMSRNTRKAIRKLKDNEGNYLLNRDLTAKWGYTLLGKDVYVSENMKDMAAGVTAIFYGDMSGLALKISEDANIQVLREKYATQHAIGVVGWVEADAKVENTQKISKLKMAAAVAG